MYYEDPDFNNLNESLEISNLHEQLITGNFKAYLNMTDDNMQNEMQQDR